MLVKHDIYLISVSNSNVVKNPRTANQFGEGKPATKTNFTRRNIAISKRMRKSRQVDFKTQNNNWGKAGHVPTRPRNLE